MDDRTKRYAHHALGYHTILLEGLSCLIRCEPITDLKHRAKAMKARAQEALSGAGPLLEEQIDAWKHNQAHPTPGFFPPAARAWEFLTLLRDKGCAPSTFFATIGELVDDLQEAFEAAHRDLDRAGYDGPPPPPKPTQTPAADQAANAPAPEPTVASGEANITAATDSRDAGMLATVLEARTAYREAREKTDRAHGTAARCHDWERACFRRLQKLRE